MQSSSGFAQVPSYTQQTYGVSTAPETAIPAQHALGLYASSAYTSSYPSSLAHDPMQPHMTMVHQTDVSNLCGIQGFSHPASIRPHDRGFSGNSPCPVAPGSENLMLGFTPHPMTSTQPQSGPDTTPTVGHSGNSDNAYVSFDEWRAQVHAKLRLTQSSNAASAGNVRLPYGHYDQQPLSWLPGALVQASAPKAPDYQYNR